MLFFRLKKDKLKELLASTPVNKPIEIEPLEPPVPIKLTIKQKRERKEARKKTIFDIAKERLSTARFR